MFTLDITHTFDLPVAALFKAWSQPAQLQKWFAPGAMTVPSAEADCRPGGHYRIVMEDADGAQHIVGGEYQTVEENQRLCFSWRWQGSEHTTLVDVRFTALSDQRSQLTLTHTEFVDQDSRDKHHQGWQGCLANLDQNL
jgi:uncharacterized protein YndB with AHSA1/START domain